MTLAHLKPESEWHAIFPEGVPIKHFYPARGFMEGAGNLKGIGPSEFYAVDLDKLTRDQYSAVMAKLSAKSGVSVEKIQADIASRGNTLPLTARHVQSISTDSRAFL